ncbi:hypothetical protein ABT187_33525 [Streptomyces sp. NPDC001817]|uniref:hypothetical protein n=1 Tax=Streptomyces sp. NPDC001817 TaxID=3154398 RepID=UPI0033308FFC
MLSVGNGSCQGETFDNTDDTVNGRDKQFLGQPLETAVPGLMTRSSGRTSHGS